MGENGMIPLNFGLFWAGAKLSYLRYLTFKSLRHFHPYSRIILCMPEQYDKTNHKWNNEKQDFETNNEGKDYIEELDKLNVEIDRVKYVGDPRFCLILQSDIWRWIHLRDNGGYYADTDQLILKSFDTLPSDNELIYCRYIEKQCFDYAPVGILGMEKGSPIANMAINQIIKDYSRNNYNSSGPNMMRSLLGRVDLKRAFNAPSNYFYPVNSSADVNTIFNGTAKVTDESYALHFFGGAKLSQEFNKNYTEDFARTSKDTISVLAKEKGIL